jgi:hypothetical protein
MWHQPTYGKQPTLEYLAKNYPMARISIFLFAFVSLLLSCKGDNPEVVNAQAVGDKAWIKSETGKNTDDLKANSPMENDTKGLLVKSLQTMQEGYKASKDKVTGIGDVTVKVDDNQNLIIENKLGSSTTTTQVNLKSLDADFKNVEIISDQNGSEFPGFKIKVLRGKPNVVISKNGTKEKEMDHLEVYMAEQKDVQQTLAALTMAIQLAQNTLPIGVD